MRLSFLELPGHERRLYFEQAAARRGLSAVVLEKDFWVCWLLDVLFRSEFPNGDRWIISMRTAAPCGHDARREPPEPLIAYPARTAATPARSCSPRTPRESRWP